MGWICARIQYACNNFGRSNSHEAIPIKRFKSRQYWWRCYESPIIEEVAIDVITARSTDTNQDDLTWFAGIKISAHDHDVAGGDVEVLHNARSY